MSAERPPVPMQHHQMRPVIYVARAQSRILGTSSFHSVGRKRLAPYHSCSGRRLGPSANRDVPTRSHTSSLVQITVRAMDDDESERFVALHKISHETRFGTVDGVDFDLRHEELSPREWVTECC
jgi:hypothetical protein